jgi:hypothetical protein
MPKYTRYTFEASILFLLVLIPYLSVAQYFVAGQDPARLKWRQIQSDNFQIIYPSDYELQAQKVACVFEKVFKFSGQSLNHQPRKISVILHTRTVKSNGFVAWSPSRVELYPTPHQGMYAQDWIEQLAIHELRHHVQIDKIESELPLIFKILLGEQAASIVIGAYLPFWFLEGDAVVSETALSKSGRGRLPSFSMELKAQADEKGIYSLDKAYLGSYKNYIPDYYQLGYQIVSNIRNQDRGEVWGDVLHYIARHPLGVNSLSRGLKLFTGKNQDQHYRLTMSNLKMGTPFGFNANNDSGRAGKIVVRTDKLYSSYNSPHLIDDSSFVAIKTSIDKSFRIVLIKSDLNEKILFEPGYIPDESINFSNGRIVWVEPKPDLRWTNKECSLLRILDVQNRSLRELIYDEKLQAPVFSPDGNIIAAVKFNNQNTCSIILISSESGEIIREFNAVGNNVYFTPSWSTDKKSLYAVELGQEGKSIVNLDLATGLQVRLTIPSPVEIRKPIQRKNYLYFTSNFAGKDEGMALDMKSNKRYCVVTAKYGIRDLQSSEDGSILIFSNYTSDGFKITCKQNSETNRKDISQATSFQDTLSANLTCQEGGIIDFSSLDSSSYKSTKFVKSKNLINIHSWAPIYIDSDQSVVNTGFSIISQNKLTTAIAQLGYDYSTLNRTGKWVGKFEYAGWYPVLRFYGDYGTVSNNYYQVVRNQNNTSADTDTVSVRYVQKVMNLRIDAAIPFNLSHGKMYRLIKPEIQAGYSQYFEDKSFPTGIFRGNYMPLTFRMYAHNIKQQSHRDLQPNQGQIVEFNYRCTPLGDKEMGKIISAEGTFFLPGIRTNQGIRLYSGYQRKISSNRYFNDLILYPRGYANIENNKLITWRSDYVIPLLYPDWNIWHLYYLKRISVRLHYDYSRVTALIYHSNSTIDKHMSSTGVELLTECHFLRFIAPVKIGLRESYLLESGSIISEFVVSVNLRGI